MCWCTIWSHRYSLPVDWFLQVCSTHIKAATSASEARLMTHALLVARGSTPKLTAHCLRHVTYYNAFDCGRSLWGLWLENLKWYRIVSAQSATGPSTDGMATASWWGAAIHIMCLCPHVVNVNTLLLLLKCSSWIKVQSRIAVWVPALTTRNSHKPK